MSKRAKSKKQRQETSKPVNYDLFNQKITFEFLKSHLWTAADILRGSLDPADYRQPIMTFLFIKSIEPDKVELTRYMSKSLGVPETELLVNEPILQKLKAWGLVLAIAIPIAISIIQLL